MKLIVVLLASAIAAPAALVPFDISGPGPGAMLTAGLGFSYAVRSTQELAL